MEFPTVKDGILYDAFPVIVLHLNNGESKTVNWFGTNWHKYVPTRYMTKGENSFIPDVKYLSKFLSDKQTIFDFSRMAQEQMRVDGARIISVDKNEFVSWDNISAFSVKMQELVYSFGDVTWDRDGKYAKADKCDFVCQVNEWIREGELHSSIQEDIEEKPTIKETKEENWDWLESDVLK